MSHSPFPWSIHPQVPHGVYDADGMKTAIAVGPNAEDNAALITAIPAMIEALEELYAMVRGECPSLLNEDSGGNAELDINIRTVLASIGKKP